MNIFSDHITKWFSSLKHDQRKDLLQDLHSLRRTLGGFAARKILVEELIAELEIMHEAIKKNRGYFP